MARKPKKSASKAQGGAISIRLQQRLREGLLIITLAFATFMLLSLSSYHRTDPSWSHDINVTNVINSGGRVGAWLSDVFLYVFGYLSYIVPLLLVYGAWLYYRHGVQQPEMRGGLPLFALRCLGFVLITVTSTAVCSLLVAYSPIGVPFSSGGIIGSLVDQTMLHVFNYSGTMLLLFAGLLLGITFLSGLSWFNLLEKIGALTFRISHWFWQTLGKINWSAMKIDFSKIKLPQRSEKTEAPVARRVEPRIVRPESHQKVLSEPTPVRREKKKEEATPVIHASIDKTPHFKGSKASPKLSLLDTPKIKKENLQTELDLDVRSREVEMRLNDFGVDAKVVAVYPGPVVTRYEIDLAAGTKASKVTGLAKDLARSLSVMSVRVVEVIPGKSVIGVELPNENRETVSLHEVIDSQQYVNARSPLTLALGKDIAGHPVIVDLSKMPHLLVAGTTGSGKSVSLNAMLLSLLYKSTPEQLRLILIDPKMLELAVYDGIPHLLTPVVTDMKDAATALRWCVVEMERRYRLMASQGVRNIAGYNAKIIEAKERGEPIMNPLIQGDEPEPLEPLPFIVVLADEFADMMVVVGKKVETLIARLAQKARASGIHLILATQRPSVDVITGLIKANIPTRMAFQVSSKVDSRTIIDQQGAENLLGHGDMLYLAPGTGVPMRVHGAFVSDDEVHRVVKYLKQQGKPNYLEDVLDDQTGSDTTGFTDAALGDSEGGDAEQDALYDQAVDFVTRSRRASVSSVQRRFKIGYNRAARIVEAMEAAGVVSPMEGSSAREVLAPPPIEE